jgi:anti-sigma B factor antagonist
MPHDFECSAELVGNDAAVVTVQGELDIHTAERLRDVLDEVGSWRVGPRLVIDLTACSFMDSTALAVLVAAKHRQDDAPLHVAAHVGAFRVLTISDLDKVLQVHRSREEALAALDDTGRPMT